MDYTVCVKGYRVVSGQREEGEFSNIFPFKDLGSALVEAHSIMETPASGLDHFVVLLFDDINEAIRCGLPKQDIKTLRECPNPSYSYLVKQLRENTDGLHRYGINRFEGRVSSLFNTPISLARLRTNKQKRGCPDFHVMNALEREDFITYGDIAIRYCKYANERGDVGYPRFFKSVFGANWGPNKSQILLRHLEHVGFELSYEFARKAKLKH